MKHLLTLLLTILTLPLFAQELPHRRVNMDWDPIDGATAYDIEFKAKPKFNKIFTIKKNEWSGKLKPGHYEMRIRAKDRRQVPGEWSAFEPITVQLEKLNWLTEQDKWEFQSKDSEIHKISFAWRPVPGARSYSILVTGPNDDFKKVFETKDPQAEFEVPVANAYAIQVEALGPNDLKSESPGLGSFQVIGPVLKTPKIRKPENKFVREVAWAADAHAKSAQVEIQRKDDMTGRWKEMTNTPVTANSFKIPNEWPGGTYRATIRSEAPLRNSSKKASLEFPVIAGDRSPAAEYVALVRESIERTKGWFAIASYLVTGMSYTGVNSDNAAGTGLRVEFPQNFGGTGRLGLGFLSDDSPWGFLGILDLSGFTVRDRNPTFASTETNLVLRSEMGGLGELRQHYGLFYKEVPEIIALNTDDIASISKIASLGPHAGLEYWMAISPKLGFQINAHIYPNLISVKTPNGNPIAPSISYQLGVLGSYRLNRKMTGLLGYAYRRDSQAYKSMSGKTNSIDLTGHYLNLFLEWSL